MIAARRSLVGAAAIVRDTGRTLALPIVVGLLIALAGMLAETCAGPIAAPIPETASAGGSW